MTSSRSRSASDAVHTQTNGMFSDGIPPRNLVLALRSMALRADDRTEPSVKVSAAPDVFDRLLCIELVKPAEERERIDGAVEKPRVELAVLVAREDPRRLLEGQDDCACSSIPHVRINL